MTLIGALVLAGWMLGSQRLMSLVPGFPVMKANTALCFALAGPAIALLRESKRTPLKHWFGLVSASVLFLVGALTSIEFLLGLNLGLDQMFFAHAVDSAALYPGRMAPATAVTLILAAASIFSLVIERALVAQTMGLGCGFFGLLTLTGYLYGVREFYYIGAQGLMAPHTALAFLLFATGVLFARPGQGLMGQLIRERRGGRMVRGLLPMALLAPLFFGRLTLQGQQAGYYGIEFGIALFALLNSLLIGFYLWNMARSLNQLDATLSHLLAQSPAVIYSFRVQGQTTIPTQVSENVTRLLGMKVEEFLQPGYVRTRIHPEDVGKALSLTSTALARGSGVGAFRIRRNDGVYRWMEDTRLLTQNDGVKTEIVGAWTDITERKAAEQAQMAAETKFRRLVEQSLAGIYVIQQGRFVYVNPKLAQMLGFSEAELTSVPMLNFVHPEDRSLVEANIRKRVDGMTESIRYELRCLRRDGKVIYLEAHGTRTDFNGHPSVLGTILDVTERKRAEEVRMRLAAIINSSNDAIISKTLDGMITSWNQGAERIFGYSAAEAIGKPIQVIIPADRLHEEGEILARIERGEVVAHFETERRRKGGGTIAVSVAVSPMQDHSGKIIGASKIARDITEGRKAEREIRELNETLEQRVRERTAELEAANRELDAFAYSVSHDLRGPLRAMDGFSKAVLERHSGQIDERGKDYLQRVRMASQRMAQLIDDLLRLSRVTRDEMHRQPVNLSEMTEAIAAELRQTDPQRNVEWVIPQGITTVGDPALLRLALTNLVGNAWKFTGKKERARIELGQTQSAGQPAWFFRDNGAGFDMEYSNRLFGAFQRLHSPQEFEGTGIGLAIVQRVIRRHGGRVWAEGAVGTGATIWFSLPK